MQAIAGGAQISAPKEEFGFWDKIAFLLKLPFLPFIIYWQLLKLSEKALAEMTPEERADCVVKMAMLQIWNDRLF